MIGDPHTASRTSRPAPPDLLATISAAARRITEVRAETIPLAMVEKAAANRQPDAAGFRRALREGPAPRVIAECKRRSPSRGILRQDYDAAAHARAYADAGAAAEGAAVVVNPNNPDGRMVPREALLDLADSLARRGGVLVVDEAFMDVGPQGESLAGDVGCPGLVVLRSFGKFFGLAGVRLGFVLAEQEVAGRLEGMLGPWAVSGPAPCGQILGYSLFRRRAV